MFVPRILHTPICASCRLRASIASKQLARSRRVVVPRYPRAFSSTRRAWEEENHVARKNEQLTSIDHVTASSESPEEAAIRARRTFGDALPDGELSEQELRVYERLYGKPLAYDSGQEIVLEDGGDEEVQLGTGVLKEVDDGSLEEVAFDVEEGIDEDEDDGGVVLDAEGPESSISEADARLAKDIETSLAAPYSEMGEEQDAIEEEAEDDSYPRAHPLTRANRFATSPSTLYLPKITLVDSIQDQLSGMSNTHLAQAAHRVFGGIGLPYSTSTPALAKTLQQKPIALEASQSGMSEIEGDVFMGVLWPGMYASVMSVLTETRKRLGTAWAEELVKKAERGDLRILDAGAGGAGVLAVREMLRAEWERMHEDDMDLGSGMALAEADGKIGGAALAPPTGHATVLTGSDVLRKRASSLLENTTFVPRLPDYVHTEQAQRKGKFDLVIAPHTLWGLREDYIRRTHVQNLWTLLSQDGGVLLLIEKGVARGFELIAGAREMLLDSGFQPQRRPGHQQDADLDDLQNERGMIIAPCTNHTGCPMYQPHGMVKGRRDICHFSQRYIRPPFLQNILGARDKNFEDVKFSYLSVMRGLDLRDERNDTAEPIIRQDDEATDRAFTGYEHIDLLSPQEEQYLSLSLPRAVLPPMKRHGHVIMDLCTPSGTLERWTVPKSFSKQAFRDARKSGWGDLWALGAKTRVPRIPKIKKRKSNADMDVKLSRSRKGDEGGEGKVVADYDEFGRVVVGEQGPRQKEGRRAKEKKRARRKQHD